VRPCSQNQAHCPSVQALADYLNDQLNGAARVQVADAATRCTRCAELLRLGGNLKAWSPDLAEDLALVESGLPPTQRWPWLQPLPIAIAVSLSFCLALLLFGYVTAPGGEPGFFSRQRIDTLPPEARVYPTPRMRLLNAPDRLVWDSAERRGSDHSVRLSLPDAVTRELPVTRAGLLKLPVDLRLIEGEYQWQVLDHNAQPVAGPYTFTIQR
jgi:hypothetical protein